MQWFVSCRGETTGPVSDMVLMQWARENRLGPGTFIRRATDAHWIPLEQTPFGAPQGVQAQIARPAQASPPSLLDTNITRPTALVALVGALMIISFISWPLGFVLAAAAAAWGVFALKKRRRSLVALVLGKPAGTAGAIGSIVAAALFATCSSLRAVGDYGQEQRAKEEAESKAQQQRQAAQERATKRAGIEREMPARVAEWKQKMAQARTTAESDPSAASALGTEIEAQLTQTLKDMGEPRIAAFDETVKEWQTLKADVKTRTDLLEAVATFDQTVARIKELIKGKQWLLADEACDEVLKAVTVIQDTPPAIKEQLAKSFDAKRKRAQVTQLKASIAGPVKRETDRKAEEAAYAAICGDPPQRSSWDGEIVGLESHIQQTAHDPDSIDVENCTIPQLTSDKVCWLFTCQVRGKNMFGAKILLERSFSYSRLGFQEVNR